LRWVLRSRRGQQFAMPELTELCPEAGWGLGCRRHTRSRRFRLRRDGSADPVPTLERPVSTGPGGGTFDCSPLCWSGGCRRLAPVGLRCARRISEYPHQIVGDGNVASVRDRSERRAAAQAVRAPILTTTAWPDQRHAWHQRVKGVDVRGQRRRVSCCGQSR
jgi:hypothetical protein